MCLYHAYGVFLKSDILLPELSPAENCDPDVIIRKGKIADFPSAIPGIEHFAWCVPGGLNLFWQGIGAFSILEGREIVIDAAADVEEGRLRLFILGAALAVLLHQRGLLVLHASAVAVGGQAILFLGSKGWGKSTLAAALAGRGHILVSDDVVALAEGEDGSPTLIPSFPQIKLWPKSIAALGINPEELPRLSTLFDKRHVDVSPQFAQGPLPLKKIFLLGVGDSVELSLVRPQDAILSLITHSYAARFSAQLLGGPAGTRHFHQCSALARRVPVYRLDRPSGLDLLPEVTSLVEEAVAL